MGILELVLLSIGLGMDAFAVSICKGLAIKTMDIKKAGVIAMAFGIFQAMMPLIGYYIGSKFQYSISKYDHWIAFILLVCIGLNMFKECFEEDSEEDESMDFKSIIVLAVATSIDALVVGITFAFLKCNIIFAISNIGIITFILSLIGVKLGSIVGNKYEKKALILGGVILIILGTKILIEHLVIK